MNEIADNIRGNLEDILSLLSSEEKLSKEISLNNCGDEKILSWSKTNAFSIIPFYNELTGFKTGEMQYKEPKNKKNAYCYLSDSEVVKKIFSYNAKGNIEDTSYIIRDENEILEIRQNSRGEFIAISKTILDNENRALTSYFANDDDNASGYYYIYDGDRISEILTVSNHSPLPYVILSCEYDENGAINKIYFNNNKGEVVVYPR